MYLKSEVAKHMTPDDYWIIMEDKVYEFKDFTGSWEMHKEYAGGLINAETAEDDVKKTLVDDHLIGTVIATQDEYKYTLKYDP